MDAELPSRAYLQSKRLSADGVEVRQFHELIIVDVIRKLGLQDLRTQSLLRIWVLGENVQDAGRRVRCCIHPGKNESTGGCRGGQYSSIEASSVNSRHLRDELVVRELLFHIR